jgi:hypothetical protein
MTKSNIPNRPIAVGFTEDEVVVTLATGTVLRNPLAWHPWLQDADAEQRLRYELGAFSIDWPELDEGLDIDGMRYGIPSDDRLRAAYEKRAYQATLLSPQDRLMVDQIRDRLTQEGADAPLAQALRLLLNELETVINGS